MAYSYKGAISFGLVYIPVTLTAAVKEHDIGFNMLEKKTLSRVKYKKTCVDCGGKEIEQGDIVKGYQYEKDKYVIFSEDDFEKIKTKGDKNITIFAFAGASEVDPIYYDRAFYVSPTGGEKAHTLLLAAMEHENKIGIAKTVLGTKETLLALRVRNGVMLASSLFFHSEIQSITKPASPKVEKAELALAVNLINNLSAKFTPEKYHDEYYLKLKRAIEEKIAGKEITTPKEKDSGNIINIMEALTKSVEMTKKKAAGK